MLDRGSPASRFDAPDDVRAALDAAWARSRQTHAARLASQEQAIVALLAGRTADESIKIACDAAHKLAGSLGTFGLVQASEWASELERFWSYGLTSELSEIRRASELTMALRRELLQGLDKPAHAIDDIDDAALVPKHLGSPVHDRPDVVLVEDDEVLAALVLEALAASGRTTGLFTDGLEAVKTWCSQESHCPRVILLDVGLPRLNGFGVLRRLAQCGAAKHSRVIMMTHRATPVDVQQATNLGIFDYVAKPFSLSLLLARVDRALEA